jgi:hypothetical protein
LSDAHRHITTLACRRRLRGLMDPEFSHFVAPWSKSRQTKSSKILIELSASSTVARHIECKARAPMRSAAWQPARTGRIGGVNGSLVRAIDSAVIVPSVSSAASGSAQRSGPGARIKPELLQSRDNSKAPPGL